MFILEAEGIVCRFGGFSALDGVTLGLATGLVTGLIGPNGAGKSTLVNVVSGLLRPTAGRVLFGGQDIANLPPERRRRVGLSRSFQRTNVFPELTVKQQLTVAARAVEKPNIEEISERLNLRGFFEVPARELSYGDQRRLDLALALIGRPKVLLLDEPAAGLTVDESLALGMTLKELTAQWNVTVLLVEHDMDVVFAVCEHLCVLHLGKVLAEGAPGAVRQHPEVIRAYLGSSAEQE